MSTYVEFGTSFFVFVSGKVSRQDTFPKKSEDDTRNRR
jgi:hypothetical protein